jgi:hypothetical protein
MRARWMAAVWPFSRTASSPPGARDHEIFLASPGAKEVPLDAGVDVAIAASRAGTHAVWSTPAGIRALVPGDKNPITVAAKGSFPNVVALPDGRTLVAWEDEGKIVIRQVP